MSFDCSNVVGERRVAMDAALLSAYMVGDDDDSDAVEEDAPEEPGWTGSWASHQAQMAFLFGGSEGQAPVPPPAQPHRGPEPPQNPAVPAAARPPDDDSESDSDDDGGDEFPGEDADVASVARAFARSHRLRRGFFASALRRRLETLQDENRTLKRLAREHLAPQERGRLFAELGSEDSVALEAARPDSPGGPGRPAAAPSAPTQAGVLRRDLLLVRVIQDAQRAFCVTDARQADNPIVWVSDAFLRMTGYSREETVGRNCRFLQGPRTDAKHVAVIRDAVEAEHECCVTLLNYRKDGTPFYNRFFVAPLRDADGAVQHYVGVQTDVTSEVEAYGFDAVARSGEMPALP